MNHTQQGFTLIELLIVIAIIGVLAALLLPTFAGAQKKPYDVAAMQCGRAVLTAQTIRRLETGSFATNVSQLGEDVAEACAQQGVQVRQYAGGTPTAASAGDGSVFLTANSVAYWTWHPRGSAAYYTSPADTIKLGRNPY